MYNCSSNSVRQEEAIQEPLRGDREITGVTGDFGVSSFYRKLMRNTGEDLHIHREAAGKEFGRK